MVWATLGLSVLKITLAATLGLLAVRLASGCAAAVRHAVLVTTFVALAAMPIVAAIAPPWFVSIEDDTWPGRATLIEFGLAPRETATASPSKRPTSVPRWPAFLFAIWASGAALCLMPQLGGFFLARRLRREGQPCAAALAGALPFSGRRQRRVRVLRHADVSGPMTCGILRPLILLPAEAECWPRQDLDRALVHELAHIARGDVLLHTIARAVCAVYWFHPLVWACWRRLRQEAERACDDVVVSRCEPAEYAQQLLTLARRQQTLLSGSMTAMADRGELAVRIHAILNSDQPRQQLGRRHVMTMAMILIACVCMVGPLTPVRTAATAHASSGLTFASASLSRSRAGQPLSMQSLPDGEVRIAGASLRRLLRLAYGLQDHAIVGAPAWADSERFDLMATAPPGSTPEDVLQMLRTLLAQRFALRTEHDRQRRPAFILARKPSSGAELRPSRGCHEYLQTSQCGFTLGPGRLEGRGINLHALATTLSTPLERAVLVEGPAFGPFDFVLTWNAAAADPVATLIEALDHQLGLAIVSEPRDVPVLVIRSARPLV